MDPVDLGIIIGEIKNKVDSLGGAVAHIQKDVTNVKREVSRIKSDKRDMIMFCSGLFFALSAAWKIGEYVIDHTHLFGMAAAAVMN